MECETWYPWTTKSKTIPFESKQSGVGHGEYKLASEYDTHIAGKNFSFDFHPNSIHGISKSVEVKTLDKDNSFRIGVTSLSDCTKAIQSVIKIFDAVHIIESKLIYDSELHRYFYQLKQDIFNDPPQKLSLYKCFMKSEVSVANVQKTETVLESIKTKYNICLNNSFKKHNIYDPIVSGQIRTIDSKSYISILQACGYDNQYMKSILNTHYESGIITYYLYEIIDLLNLQFSTIFNNIIHDSLSHVEVVIVAHDGYKWVKKENICFNRITNGGLRCKLLHKV